MIIVITRLLINKICSNSDKKKPDQDGLLQEIFVKSFSHLY